MASFEDVVKQLQMNNRSEAGRDSRHTRMLGELKTAIEGVSEQVASTEESPSAKKEDEKNETEKSRSLLKAIGGLGNSIQGAFSSLGAIKTPIPGLTLGLLAKLAVIPLLIRFLQSPLWDEIKTLLLNPSIPRLKDLFAEYNTELTIFAGVIGTWAIVKLTTTATAIATSIGGIGTALTALGAVFGISGAAAAGTILFILAGVVAAGKGILDGVEGFKKKFEETDSVILAIGEGLKEFTSGFLAFFPDLIKTGLAKLIGLVDEDMGKKIDSFNFKESINNFIDGVFKNIEKFFESFKNIFAADKTFEERLDAALESMGSIFDIVMAPVNAAYDMIKSAVSLTGFEAPDLKFSDLVKNAFSTAIDLFKKLSEISTDDIINSIPGARGLLKTLGFLEKSTQEKIEEKSDQIRKLEEAIAKNTLLSVGISAEDEKRELAQAQQELAGLQQIKLMEQQGMPAMHTGGFLAKGQIAMVGEQGPEFIMSRSPAQVFSEQRTDQLGMAALNKLMSGGNMGGGSGTMFLNTGSNVQNVNKSTIVTPIVDQDPVIRQVGRSLAM